MRRLMIINLPKYRNNSKIKRKTLCGFSGTGVGTPASLLVLAAMLRRGNIEIEFIDANAFNLDYQAYFEKNEGHTNQLCFVLFPFVSSIIETDMRICRIAKKFNLSL